MIRLFRAISNTAQKKCPKSLPSKSKTSLNKASLLQGIKTYLKIAIMYHQPPKKFQNQEAGVEMAHI